MSIQRPLRPWAWCLGWLIVICLILIIFTKDLSPLNYVANNIEASDFNAMDTVTVMALGSSLLRVSLPVSIEFDSLLGDDIDWLHIWVSGGRWLYFSPLLPRIRELNPEVIFVHDELLNAEDKHPHPFFHIRRSVRFLIRKGVNILASVANPTQSKNTVIRERKPVVDPQDIGTKRHYLSTIYTSNTPLNNNALDFLKQLKAVARSVVVFDLPRSQELQVDEAQINWEESMRLQLSKLDIQYVKLGEPLPRDHYTDGAHPNKKGLTVRLEQFKTLVAEQLR